MRLVLALTCVLLLVSCETISYYSQAIGGQLAILGKRSPIEKLVNDPATSPQLKSSLESILAIRAFAENELALLVGKSFSTYADIERSFAVWIVFAAPEFSLTPQQWCYPIVGCVTYRGYFSENRARDYGQRLAEQGKDVYVGGVAAYSTLGWFADPVLNTVIERDAHRLAALMFHELAHQVVYVPGDTEFNESFATAVEMEGLKRWLEQQESGGRAVDVLAQMRQEQQYRNAFIALVKSYIPRFEDLYDQELPVAVMREQKAGLVEQLRESYADLKITWKGYAVYDVWFNTPINNAKLNTVGTYFNLVPAFHVLLAESGHQLPVFYERVQALADMDRDSRHEALARLVE